MSMIPNTQRMREVLKWCKENPDKFNQKAYYFGGNTRCFLGRAIEMYGNVNGRYQNQSLKIFNINQNQGSQLGDVSLSLEQIETNIEEFEKMAMTVPTKEEFIDAYIKIFEDINNDNVALEKTLSKFWPGRYDGLNRDDHPSLKLAKILQNWNPPPRKTEVEVDKKIWDKLIQLKNFFGFKNRDQVFNYLRTVEKLDYDEAEKLSLMFYHNKIHNISAYVCGVSISNTIPKFV